jgi:hypothetical protein
MNRLLRGIVRTNDYFGLGAFVPLLDPSHEALVVFEDVELHSPVYGTSWRHFPSATVMVGLGVGAACTSSLRSAKM